MTCSSVRFLSSIITRGKSIDEQNHIRPLLTVLYDRESIGDVEVIILRCIEIKRPNQITMKVSSLLVTDIDAFNQHLVKSSVVANPFRRVSTQQLLDGILLGGRRNGKI